MFFLNSLDYWYDDDSCLFASLSNHSLVDSKAILRNTFSYASFSGWASCDAESWCAVWVKLSVAGAVHRCWSWCAVWVKLSGAVLDAGVVVAVWLVLDLLRGAHNIESVGREYSAHFVAMKLWVKSVWTRNDETGALCEWCCSWCAMSLMLKLALQCGRCWSWHGAEMRHRSREVNWYVKSLWVMSVFGGENDDRNENSLATQNRRSPSAKTKGALGNEKHVNTCWKNILWRKLWKS